MSPVSVFSGFAQMAYVTTDIDQAMALFAEQYGIAQFMALRDISIETGTDRKAVLDVALANVGSVQIELIQPKGGDDAIYRSPLSSTGFALQFHHVAQMLPSLQALAIQRAEQIRQGHTIVIEGESPGVVSYFYSDHRAALGHYVEHCYYTEQGLAFQKQIPRY
jgi:hypothetical protein